MDNLLIIVELILMDLVLGGDNAVVIALATKNLEGSLKRKASILGAMFAIALRLFFVFVLLFLEELSVPLLFLIAGILLIYIAFNLVKDEEEVETIEAKKSIWGAVKTIIVADAIMSLDNVIVITSIVATAAVSIEIQILLVFAALLVSFPIILFGASILSKIIEKYKFVIYICSVLLIHVGIDMIIKDPIFHELFLSFESSILKYLTWLLAILILVVKVKFFSKKTSK